MTTFADFPAGTPVVIKGTGHFGTVSEHTTEGGRPEIMVELGDMWLGFQPHELAIDYPVVTDRAGWADLIGRSTSREIFHMTPRQRANWRKTLVAAFDRKISEATRISTRNEIALIDALA